VLRENPHGSANIALDGGRRQADARDVGAAGVTLVG
jgi:hypothetical protein